MADEKDENKNKGGAFSPPTSDPVEIIKQICAGIGKEFTDLDPTLQSIVSNFATKIAADPSKLGMTAQKIGQLYKPLSGGDNKKLPKKPNRTTVTVSADSRRTDGERPMVTKPVNSELERQMDTARKIWADVDIALASCDRVLMWGTPGTGKSARAMRGIANVQRVYITIETPKTDIAGHWVQGPQGMYWHDGPATVAWLQGTRLVVEEIDSASGDALTHLLAVGDDRETARFTLPNGKTIVPQPGFSMVATTNENPSVIPSNLLDRFDAVIHIPTPNPEVFEKAWSDPDLREACKRVVYLNEYKVDSKNAGTGGNRNLGLRAFLAVDRMVGRGVARVDAARLVMGAEAAKWLDAATNIATITP